MLPEDRPLTDKEVAAIAREFKAFRREHSLSLEALSKRLGSGFSAATLSHFENGHKRGDHEKVARAVNAHMEVHARQAEAARPEGFVETRVAKRILTVIRTAIESRSIGVVTGSAGMGKTLTARTAHLAYPGSIYLRVTQSERRNTGLVQALARMLNIPVRNSLAQTHRLLMEHLAGTGRALLIDEAHKLHAGALDAIRDIHDEAGVPVVLFGTVDLKKSVDDTEVFFGQFSSRIVAHVDLTDMAIRPRRGGRSEPLFTVEEVLKVFASAKVRLSDDAARMLAQLACLPGLGSLRLCAKIIDLATRIGSLRGEVIQAKDIRAICRQMHGDAYIKLMDVRTEQLHIAGAAEAKSA